MTTFDDLPLEIRNKVMYLRARANYRQTFLKYKNGWLPAKRVMKEVCRSRGLHVSGNCSQLIRRIRKHKWEVLDEANKNSVVFWYDLKD
eukprot:4788878-Prymnesium_polylepis.1